MPLYMFLHNFLNVLLQIANKIGLQKKIYPTCDVISPDFHKNLLQGCEMLRIPHCLDNRLTDGSKVVSPTHPPRSTPQEHYFSVSGTRFG
jgi:hypothetical protein